MAKAARLSAFCKNTVEDKPPTVAALRVELSTETKVSVLESVSVIPEPPTKLFNLMFPEFISTNKPEPVPKFAPPVTELADDIVISSVFCVIVILVPATMLLSCKSEPLNCLKTPPPVPTFEAPVIPEPDCMFALTNACCVESYTRAWLVLGL